MECFRDVNKFRIDDFGCDGADRVNSIVVVIVFEHNLSHELNITK